MGFGTLFVFYVMSFVLSLNPFGSLFTLVGYAGMMMALWELQQYEKSFLSAFAVTPLLILTAAYKSLALLQESFGIAIPLLSPLLSDIVRIAEYALLFIFHAALLYAIRAIAQQVGVTRLVRGAARNAIVVTIYYVLYAIALLPIPWAQTYQQYMAAPVILLQLLWIGLNVWLLWMCYVHICKEGDEEVPLRVSRFGFVNRIRQELERKEQQGIQSTVEHARNNRRQHAENNRRIREMRIERAEKHQKKKKK